ncbi:hypothetical protein [Bradyrhizobium sp. 45]|uniref:hypothetical protein n=1 Tax=Bradyrhizobium sp. 45 TaxID=1043587 RepID=UPI001FF71546|nr:hypothetical protein [Bradyrhizobium sp. 45]MCK1306528.1 hypothetical protein [Bradyrhizobium sp. 45]
MTIRTLQAPKFSLFSSGTTINLCGKTANYGCKRQARKWWMARVATGLQLQTGARPDDRLSVKSLCSQNGQNRPKVRAHTKAVRHVSAFNQWPIVSAP